MTNDRRKTFNTPLDALRWLLENPKHRKLSGRKGVVVHFALDSKSQPQFYDEYGCPVERLDQLCPLTAVEDEHGVIEEGPKWGNPKGQLVQWLEELAQHPANEPPIDLRTIAEEIAFVIRKEIDERIAAATVEQKGDDDEGK